MKTFNYDSHVWKLSKCDNFVSMYFEDVNEWSGWFALTMFNEQLQQAAKQAK